MSNNRKSAIPGKKVNWNVFEDRTTQIFKMPDEHFEEVGRSTNTLAHKQLEAKPVTKERRERGFANKVFRYLINLSCCAPDRAEREDLTQIPV